MKKRLVCCFVILCMVLSGCAGKQGEAQKPLEQEDARQEAGASAAPSQAEEPEPSAEPEPTPEPEPAEPEPTPQIQFHWAYVLAPLGVIAVIGGSVGAALFIKKRREAGYETEEDS